MNDFHFVRDYTAHVESLMQTHPMDEAMSLAVGGNYDLVGGIAAQIVRYAAPNAKSFLDFGCGSGRVAHHLAKTGSVERYTGVDIIEPLLAYAATKTPDHFEFVLNRSLKVPVESNSIDCAFAFSVITHLQQTEIYLYLRELHRCLIPRGALIVSFLEMVSPWHWEVFRESVEDLENDRRGHLNMFTERSQLQAMGQRIGLEIMEYIDGTDDKWTGGSLGQSVAIFSKIPGSGYSDNSG